MIMYTFHKCFGLLHSYDENTSCDNPKYCFTQPAQNHHSDPRPSACDNMANFCRRYPGRTVHTLPKNVHSMPPKSCYPDIYAYNAPFDGATTPSIHRVRLESKGWLPRYCSVYPDMRGYFFSSSPFLVSI